MGADTLRNENVPKSRYWKSDIIWVILYDNSSMTSERVQVVNNFTDGHGKNT